MKAAEPTRTAKRPRGQPRLYVVGLILAVVCVTAGPVISKAEASALDTQLVPIGSEIKDQLAKTEVDAERAETAIADFKSSLTETLSTPLTQEQSDAVLGSLEKRRFSLWYPYADHTDLELQYYGLVWTDMIKLYVQRKPMGADEEQAIARQIESLLGAAQATMGGSLKNQPEATDIPKLIQYGRDLLYHELNDPVLPALKRSLTEPELEALRVWVCEEISSGISRWSAEPEDTRVLEARDVLCPIMTNLWAEVWRMQYAAPSLSPRSMEQMRAERTELIQQRAERFRQLPPAEKKKELQALREAEGRKGGSD